MSSWMFTLFSVSAAFFVTDALLLSHSYGDPFTPGVSVAIAAYCLLVMTLLRISEGEHRRIMLIFCLPLLLSYIIRLLVLCLDAKRLIVPPNIVFTSDDILRCLGFIALGTIAFWLGTKVAMRSGREPTIESLAAIDQAAYRLRGPLIVVAIPLSAIAALLPALGLVSRVQTEATAFTAVAQVLPVEAATFMIMFLAVRHWSRLLPPERIGIVIALLFFVTRDLVYGRRSALFSLALLWIMTNTWAEPLSKRFNVKKTLLAGLSAILIAPVFLSYIIAFRISGESTVDRSEALAQRSQYSIEAIGEFVTDSQAGFDSTLSATTFMPFGLPQQLSLASTAQTMASQITPDRLWKTEKLTLGRLYTIYYFNFPLHLANSGAWSGFGLAFGLGGWFGLIAIVAWGFGVMALVRRWRRVPRWGGGLSVYSLSVLVAVTVKSGNIDVLLAQYIAQIVGAFILFIILEAIWSAHSAVPRNSPSRGSVRSSLED